MSLTELSKQKNTSSPSEGGIVELIRKDQLNYLFEQAPAAIMIFKGPDAVFELANKKALELMGRTKEEVTGRKLAEVMPELKEQGYVDLLKRVYKTGEQYVSEESPVSFNSSSNKIETFIKFVFQPVLNEEGEVDGVMALIDDVKKQVLARKKIEEAEKELRTLIDSVSTDFHDLKISQERLRQSEEKNRLFIEYAPAAMAMFDKDMKYVSVSKRWMKEYDLQGNITGKKHYDLFPNILERWKAVHSRCMKGAVERSDEDYYEKDDGTPVWLKWEVYPWYNADNDIGGIVIFTENITDRKITEQVIKESEERFRTMAEEAPLFVWVADGDLQTTYLNSTGLSYFNLDRDIKMSELSWKKFIHPGDIENVLSVMNDAAQKHQPYTLEMRLRNGATNEYRWFLDKGTPTYNEEKFTGFIGTSLDIHERKEAEKELEKKVADRTGELNRQNILLKQQNNLVKKILDSSVDLIAVYDTDTRVISINQSSLNLLRVQKEEDILGKKIAEVVPQIKDTKGYKDLLRAINGEIIHNEIYHSPVAKRYYENFMIPLKDDNDKTYAVLVMGHDNTELISSSEQLQLKNEELQKTIQLLHSQELREEQKNNFIQMASHELKTPITSMQGYVQLLLSAYKEDNEKSLSPLFVRSSLNSIEKQIKRLTRLISELLDLSKIDAGQLKLNSELFSLNELAIDIVQDILHTNPKHPINLFHDVECSINGDKDRIGQVLTNLLTNAIKYSPSSEKIDIWIKKATDSKVAVSVKDYGIGIAEKEQNKIFERFYRIKGQEVDTYPGFGIGLFIARDIVQKHNGEITVESEIKKGSVFTFTLPVADKI
jgi:PAS domain S-box-containing protein